MATTSTSGVSAPITTSHAVSASQDTALNGTTLASFPTSISATALSTTASVTDERSTTPIVSPQNHASSSSIPGAALRRPLNTAGPASSTFFTSGIPPAPSGTSSSSTSTGPRIAGVTTPTASRTGVGNGSSTPLSARSALRPNVRVERATDPSTALHTNVGGEDNRSRIQEGELPQHMEGPDGAMPTGSARASSLCPRSDVSANTHLSNFAPFVGQNGAQPLGSWRGPSAPPQTWRFPSQHLRSSSNGRYGYPSSTSSFNTPRRHVFPNGLGGHSTTDNGAFQENSLISFSWAITDLRLLREEVEHTPLAGEEGRSVSAGAGKSEIWTTHPIFGDGKWKAELIRTARMQAGATDRVHTEHWDKDSPDGGKDSETLNVLSLFLTSMTMDYSTSSIAIPTELFLGIRPLTKRRNQDPPPLFASPHWFWTHSTPFTFKYENEFYHCSELPSISTLLADEAIARVDGCELVIQIAAGSHILSPQALKETKREIAIVPFHVPKGRFVPDSLLACLENLVDCATTGDLALIVQERGVVQASLATLGTRPPSGLEVLPWPVGTPMPLRHDTEASVEIVVRDRVVWAHTAILTTRSEYFRIMLASAFAEGTSQEHGKHVRILRIDDVDYTTVQGLLRYLYTSNIDFMNDEDIRSVALNETWLGATQTVWSGEGSTSRSEARTIRPPVWRWRSLSDIESENEEGAVLAGDPFTHQDQRRSISTSSSRHPSEARQSVTLPSPTSTGRIHQSPPTSPAAPYSESTSSRFMTSQVFQQNEGHPGSRYCGHSKSLLSDDPHPHPAQVPGHSVSALAMYKLCHRYGQNDLLSLSSFHLLSNLNEDSAFPTLLATCYYADLQHEVEKFVLENARGVLASKEFERCCDEVSSGDWGTDAGRTLRSLMRSMMGTSSSVSDQLRLREMRAEAALAAPANHR